MLKAWSCNLRTCSTFAWFPCAAYRLNNDANCFDVSGDELERRGDDKRRRMQTNVTGTPRVELVMDDVRLQVERNVDPRMRILIVYSRTSSTHSDVLICSINYNTSQRGAERKEEAISPELSRHRPCRHPRVRTTALQTIPLSFFLFLTPPSSHPSADLK